MKNLVAALTVLLFAGAAQASTSSVKFVSVDNSLESKLCVIAAEQGYNAALNYADKADAKHVKTMSCNGKNIKRFSQSYQVEAVTAKTIVVVPANNNAESKICAQAVQHGLAFVTESANSDVSQTVCNGQKITQFVKQYSSL